MISVIINTYNQAPFITQALESAVTQPGDGPREIVVIDDGSSDRTEEMVRQFLRQHPAPRILYRRRPNGGQASALNDGAHAASGDIFCFLDGDDYFLPGKLSTVVHYFRSFPEIEVLGHGIRQFSKDGGTDLTVREPTPVSLRDAASAAQFCRLRALLGTSRLAMRAAAAKRLFPIPQTLRFEADEYLFTKAALQLKVLVVPEVLTAYRLHRQNHYMIEQYDRQRLCHKRDIIDRVADCIEELIAQSDCADRPQVQEMVNRLNRHDRTEISLYTDAVSWKQVRAFGLEKKFLLRKLLGPGLLWNLSGRYAKWRGSFKKTGRPVLL